MRGCKQDQQVVAIAGGCSSEEEVMVIGSGKVKGGKVHDKPFKSGAMQQRLHNDFKPSNE